MNWYQMTQAEKKEFNTRHNLSNHPSDLNVIEAARYDLQCLNAGQSGLYEVGDLDWMIAPLKELGQDYLYSELMRFKKELGL